MAISKIGSKALTDSSVVAADIAPGTVTTTQLAGSITNAKLSNSTVTVNGTAIALGASASLEAISWQAVKTTDFNAVAGEGYFVNTTSAVVEVTLPASPSIGDTIAIKDYAGTYASNALTIARNGKNIQGVANNSLISTNRASLILVFVDDTKGWVYTVESNVADLQGPVFTSATGGTVTESGDFKIHSFTGDGSFVISQLGNSPIVPTGGPSSVDYLVVGGGAGGGFDRGGGGGAGGYRTSFPAGPTAIIATATTYTITVGAGGAGQTSYCVAGTNGSNSVFSTITSTGGGKGAGAPNSAPTAAESGGSGGGGHGQGPITAGTGNTPPTSPSQGNNGGAGHASPYYGSGGGGGAANVGGAGTTTVGGVGGAGSTNNITGSPVAYGGGGGGSVDQAAGAKPGGAGGIGGGGPAGSAPGAAGTAGTTNTGGGGGGAANLPTNNAGSGGSGIVIIRYKFQ